MSGLAAHPPQVSGFIRAPPFSPPVDSPPRPAHLGPVSKKPRKVEETKSPYPATPAGGGGTASSLPATTAGGTAADQAFKKTVDRLFTERKDLLRRLAQ